MYCQNKKIFLEPVITKQKNITKQGKPHRGRGGGTH